MKNILRFAALLLCTIFMVANAGAQNNYNATTMGEKVYLETANWGQNSPFNKQIFTSYGGSTNAKAGCVPTAYAIVMRYHGFPEEGTATVLYNCQAPTYVEITDRVYDFSKMPLTYNSDWTQEQIDEVSKFFSHVLHACFPSSIGTGATTVNEGQTSKVLNDYFNYQLINASYQANFTMEQWAEKLRESIDNGCPVPYAANNSGTGDSRHMFVVDGYTTEGYFHFNFGWSGSGNGWFKLDNITPSQGDNYSWNGKSEHYALFNLAPNRTMRTVTASVSPTGAGSVTVNGSANSAEVTEGTTATLVATANSGYTFSHWSKGGTEVGTEMTYKAKVAAEGNEYVANFYTIGSSINIPVNYDSNMGSVTYNGNIVSATGFNPNEYSEVTLTAEANDGYMFTGWEITEGTETTKSSEKSITFIAKSGITVNANFALAGGEYKINKDNVTISGGNSSYCSTWTYTKDGDIEGILTLSTVSGSTVVNALSGSSNKLYAQAFDDNGGNESREITYTLTAKEGFVITGYSLTYVVGNSYKGYVTIRNATQSLTPNDTKEHTLTYQYTNAARSSEYGTRTAEFILSSTGGSRPYITIKDLSVTVLSEGAEGGSTPTPDPTPTTCTITTTANPAEGGTAKFAVGTGSQKTEGDVNNGEQITLYAVANTGYTFVNWTLNGTAVSTSATCNVNVAQAANYVANFEAVQQGGSSSTNLAGKYFRLRVKDTTNYMNIANNTEHSGGTTGGVNVTAKNESNGGQIFKFIESGTGYKLLSKTGYYIKCQPWNVDAISVGTVLSFETAGADNEYFIKWDNTNMDNGKERDDYFKAENGYVYCDAASTAATVWILEEVVYYTIAVTAGTGGSAFIGAETSTTVEQGKPVTLTATANEGYRFVNWTLNGTEVSTNESYTFNATAAGEYVANFEISTYTISATANPGTAGSVTINGEAVSSKNVNENSTVVLVATPQAGYCFVNWTKDEVEVSTDATYSFTATEITSLVANFKQIVVNATLTDAQDNTYNVQLSGFTTGITTATVATKLTAKYPYITLGDNATLNGGNAAYTYTNRVTLPFKVSSVSDATNTYWHNIYYPSNGDARNPNYIAALNKEDAVVDMAASPEYAYGDNPTYNTKAGNPMISWAVYSVKNSFEFVFKNELTNKYIKVESVVNATGNTQNVKFVENAGDATAFTLLKDAGSYNGDYALVAKVGDATGYLCATSSSTNYVTHFDHTNHQGAWVKFVEVDYGQYIKVLDTKLRKFDVGDDKHMITDEIRPMINALVEDYGVNITKSQFEAYFDAIDAMDAENWPKLNLTIAPDNSGTTTIAGEEGVTRKYVPTGDLTINATPAEGYHFVSWTSGTNEVSTVANYTFNITAATALTANFAKNTYTISVSANGTGGSAMIGTETSTTVEHGGEVKLTAVASEGYHFVNWTLNGTEVSTDANYTVTNVTANAEYVANFQLANTPATHCNVTVNANISGTGIAFIDTGTSTDVTSGRYEVGSTIKLTAVSDKDENGYLFTGWYVGGKLISTEKTFSVTLSSDVTYTAMFEEGWRVRYSCNYRMGYIRVLDADGNDIGGTNYVLVKKGSTIKMLGVPESGYEFKNWTTNATSDFVSNDNPYSFAVEENMNLTANFEPEHYVLTVRANNDEYGTVTAESGTFGPAESVKVGIAMTATITAIAKDGYKFVNWTKDSEVVSTDAIYTVPSVDYSEYLIDTEYIANFEPIENATPGIYYRIGYDVTVPAAAGAARAATDETQTYVVSPNTGTLTGGNPSSEWVCTGQPALTITATNDDGAVKNIYSISNGTKLSFNAYKSPHYTTTYTISVTQNSGYRIIGYSMSYSVYLGARVQNEINNYDVTPGANKTGTMEAYGIDVQNVVFTVTRTGGQDAAIDISSFTVTLQQVDSGGEVTPETPETTTNRYYVLSKPVSGTNNAMVMEMETEENYASSIFYYAGDKLLSYDKGLYVKEYDNTRGLQAVGEEPGTVKITTVGQTSTIAAPSYMHASVNGTTYFVDHCGSDNGDPEHNFVLEEMTALPVTIGNALHATLYAPVALEIPVGVKAYVLKEKDIKAGSYVTMSRLSSIIPANTGVILKSEKAGRFDFVITESTYDAEEKAYGNVLEGTVAKSIVNEDAYILANRNGNIGLYPLNTNSYITGEATSTFTNNSHKAYLPVKGNFAQWLKESNGFRFVFDDDIVTDLHEVETDEDIETIYDLQGRKLSEITQPGMYIINGKKVWVK